MGVRQSLTRVVQRISHVATTPTACAGCGENHIIAHSWVAIRAAYQPFLTVSEGFLAITQCSACFKRERHAYLRRVHYPREARRVRTNVERAVITYRTATLTIAEWLDILDHHDWRCAYCQKPFAVLEHVQPLKHGGGTTTANCVPACGFCNSLKADRRPEQIVIAAQGLQRVLHAMAEPQVMENAVLTS
jgi:5-methylcytosine-specific restriction endonuclease McrA